MIEPWSDCIVGEDGETIAGPFSETDLSTEQEVVIKFSLGSEGSIKRQLESAERLLKRLRREFETLGRLPQTKEARGTDRATMIKHLRVLDALAAGESNYAIGVAFYAPPAGVDESKRDKSINWSARGGEARRAAEEWRDSKYKLLLEFAYET
jgi:hypothetical protein